ncbi:MAG TPA: hypothetical protein VIH11_06380, partial [Gemmatimonadaceae bacterium]
PGCDRLKGGPGDDVKLDYRKLPGSPYDVPSPAVIDWSARLGDADPGVGRKGKSWTIDFVTSLGQTALERNPNLRIKLEAPAAAKAA